MLEDVRTMKSEVGVVSFSNASEGVLRKLFKEYQLEFTPLMIRETYIYVWKNHKLAGRKEISIEELRRLFETDYFGLVQVTQAVLPVMRGQKSGRILNVASQSGLIAGAGTSAYNAVKFAVVGLTEALNLEMAPWGIEAMVVCPGPFRTDFRDASSAMRPGNLMPEYDGTPAHELLNYLDENNHTQSGDPAKAAAVVYKIATAERMPGRLALGSTCTAGYERFLKSQLEQLSSYRDLSGATDFD